MKEPRTFTKSIYSAYTLMILVYLCTSALGYLAFGRDVAGFLPDSMQNGTAKSLVGLLLTLHTGVAYMVTAQPLHRAIHGFLFPQTVLEPSSIQQPRAAIHWLCISTGQMTISILLATAVPFFAELQSLLGALTGAPMIFGAPALFYVRGRWLHGLPIKTVDMILCGVFLCVLTPLFTIAGTATSIVRDCAGVGGNRATVVRRFHLPSNGGMQTFAQTYFRADDCCLQRRLHHALRPPRRLAQYRSRRIRARIPRRAYLQYAHRYASRECGRGIKVVLVRSALIQAQTAHHHVPHPVM